MTRIKTRMELSKTGRSSTLNIVTDARFFYGSWGIMGESGRFGQGFFEEAFSIFDHVRLISRMERLKMPPRNDKIMEGNFDVFPLPMIRGAKGYLCQFPKLMTRLYIASRLDGIFLLRVPGFIPTLIWALLTINKRSYAVEVIGFPSEALKTSGLKLAQVLALVMEKITKLQCEKANAACYVTSYLMPSRYDCGGPKFCIAGTRSRDFTIAPARVFNQTLSHVKLLHIGTMSTLYKGQTTLLQAVRILIENGISCYCTMVGDGFYRPLFEKQARELGIHRYIKFTGYVPGGIGISNLLDCHDILVVSSLSEGLPNVVIEGMMRAIPVISSNVGGLPELLDFDCLFGANDHECLARRIRELVNNPMRLSKISFRTTMRVQKYLPEVLVKKRIRFYSTVKRVS